MYRGIIGGKEVIVRLGKRLEQVNMDRDKIYNTVMSYGEALFGKGNDSFCIFTDRLGIIVGEIEQNEIPVIRIDYLIQSENVYE